MRDALLVVAGALLSVLFAAVFQSWLQRIATMALGRFGVTEGPTARGAWRASYRYFSTKEQKMIEVDETILVRQLGSRIVGMSLETNSTHRHNLEGEFADRVITGEWISAGDHAVCHGAFQLVMDPNGQSMGGRWIGFDRRNVVQHAAWQWTRADDPSAEE